MIKHDKVDPHQVVQLIEQYISEKGRKRMVSRNSVSVSNSIPPSMVLIRFEHFLLHCECVSAEMAFDVVETAREAGLRNSGVTS